MKRSEILFGLLKLPIDILMVTAGLLAAYRLRLANIDLIPRIQLLLGPPQLPDLPYYVAHFVVPVVALYIVILIALRLYALRITLSAWHEMGRIIIASFVWIALVISWFFLVQRQLFFSRILLLHSFVLITLLVMVGRTLILLIQRWCVTKGIGVRTVFSFGRQQLPEAVERTFARDRRFHYLGHTESIDALRHKESHINVDLVLHTDPNPGSEETVRLINHCRNYHIGYAFLPPVFADVPHQLVIDHLDMVPILRFQPTPLDGWGRVWKRLADVVLGILLFILISPVLLIISILILLIDGSPVFYVSRRVGQYGVAQVPLLKFRTMHPDADSRKAHLTSLSHRSDGPLFKIKDDPRVTRFGRVLRRLSIDELPQLLNVIIGHLSLVGPRPHLQEEVARYTEEQRRVFAVKPGITGLSQISGRSDLKFDQEAQLDLRYIEEWSPFLDLWILWRTVFVVLQGEGAD